MDSFSISYPTRVIFQENSIEQLPLRCGRFGNKALIITSRQLFPESDVIEKIISVFNKSHINCLLYDDLPADANSNIVTEIATLAKSSRCDFVIGLGGDVVLNCARGVALMCTNSGTASDYLTEQHGYRLKINRLPLPMVMIPANIGTLCEVSPGFVLTDAEDGIRKKLYSESVYPSLTLLDPVFSSNLSKKYLAASGLLVLAYGIELLLSTASNNMSDMFASKAIDLVYVNLPKAIKNPENTEFRASLMSASLMISYGVTCGMLGSVFSFCEALSSISPIYKGSIASIILPQIMEYNLTSAASKYIQLIRVFGEDISDISVLEAGIKAVEKVRLFVESFNIPGKLTDIGYEPNPNIDLWSVFSRFEEVKYLPRPIGQSDLTAIVEQSL